MAVCDTTPWGPEMTPFRCWQALEHPAVVEAQGIEEALSRFDAAISSPHDPRICAELLLGQAVALNHLFVRAVEFAGMSDGDWDRRVAFVDLALRAQSQSVTALVEAQRFGGTRDQ